MLDSTQHRDIDQDLAKRLSTFHRPGQMSPWVRGLLECRGFPVTSELAPHPILAEGPQVIMQDLPERAILLLRIVTSPDDERGPLLIPFREDLSACAVGIIEVFLQEYYENLPAEGSMTPVGPAYRVSLAPIRLYVNGPAAQAAADLLQRRYGPLPAGAEWQDLLGPSDFIR